MTSVLVNHCWLILYCSTSLCSYIFLIKHIVYMHLLLHGCGLSGETHNRWSPNNKAAVLFFISCSFTWFCIWVAVDLNLLTVIFLFFFFFLCCWKLLYALFLFFVILYLLIITECVNMFSWWKLILFILLNDDMTLISRCRVTRFLSIVLFF